MLKLVDCKISETPETITMDKLKPLEIGVIVGGIYKPGVVMRTAAETNFEVILLDGTTPNNHWVQKDTCKTIKVRLLNKGEDVTLKIYN